MSLRMKRCRASTIRVMTRRAGTKNRSCLPTRVACAVSLCASLFSAPAAAYRTAADGQLLAGAGRVAWSNPAFALALDVDSIPPGLEVDDVELALHQALAAWSAPACTVALPGYAGRTRFDPQAMDGINTIAWVSDWAGHGFPDYSAGSTDVQYLNSDGAWEIAEADIYLRGDLSWSVTGASASKDLAAVLTHEIGHALGLLHPCEPDGAKGAPRCDSGSFTDETMYPIYEPGASTLADDDIAGVCYLYPLPDGCAKCAASEACVNGACVAECLGRTCMPGERCGFWGCSPSDACLRRDCTGSSCQSDAACAPFGLCREGVCARGGKRITEACTLTADCAEGVCTNGRCSSACSADAPCAAGSCSLAIEPGLTGCATTGSAAFGDVCTKPEECASGLCVDTSEMRTCTVRCSRDSECPSPQTCATVDGVAVCVAEPTFPYGGCTLAAPAKGRSSEGPRGAEELWSAAVLVCCVGFRRWKRRMR